MATVDWPRESRLDEAAIIATQNIRNGNLEAMVAGFVRSGRKEGE